MNVGFTKKVFAINFFRLSNHQIAAISEDGHTCNYEKGERLKWQNMWQLQKVV